MVSPEYFAVKVALKWCMLLSSSLNPFWIMGYCNQTQPSYYSKVDTKNTKQKTKKVPNS